MSMRKTLSDLMSPRLNCEGGIPRFQDSNIMLLHYVISVIYNPKFWLSWVPFIITLQCLD